VLWALLYVAFTALGRWLVATGCRPSVRLLRGRLTVWLLALPGLGDRSSAVIVAILAAGGLAAVAAGAAFLEVAEHARLTTGSLYRADHVTNAWLQDERCPGVTALLRAVTIAAGPTGMTVLVAILAAGLLLRRHRASAAYLAIVAAGGVLLNQGLKAIFARARPLAASAIAAEQGYSFPSGHAMGSFIVFGAIAYLVVRQAWRWKVKSAWLAMLLALVVLVGLSRVYLGVHWVSDIAAGWSAGAVWLATTTVAFETVLRVRQRRYAPGASAAVSAAGAKST